MAAHPSSLSSSTITKQYRLATLTESLTFIKTFSDKMEHKQEPR